MGKNTNKMLAVSSAVLGTLIGGPLGTIIGAMVGAAGEKILDSTTLGSFPSTVQKAYDAYQSALEKCVQNGDIRNAELRKFGQRLEAITQSVREEKKVDFSDKEKKIIQCFYEELKKDSISYISILDERLADNQSGAYQNTESEIVEVLNIYKEFAKENPKTYRFYVARTLNNLAILHSVSNRFVDAKNEYEEALKIYEKLAENDSQSYRPYEASTLNNLAILHYTNNRYEKAEEVYVKALKIYEELAKENPKSYRPHVARTLNNLAKLHCDNSLYEKAEEEYKEALKIQRRLALLNPQSYLPDLAMTMNCLATLYILTCRYEKADEEYQELLFIFREFAENPDEYEPNVAEILSLCAYIDGRAGQIEKAENTYNEVFKRYEELAEKVPEYECKIAETLNLLANLYCEVRRYDEAVDKYKASLKIYEKLSTGSPKLFEPMVAQTRSFLARLYIYRKNNSQAEEECKNALKRYYGNPEVSSYPSEKVIVIHYLLAYLYKESQNDDDAKKELEKALDIFRRLFSEGRPLSSQTLDAILFSSSKERRGDYHDILFDYTLLISNVGHNKKKQAEQAKQEFESGLKVYKNTYPSDYLGQACLLKNYAKLLISLKDEHAASTQIEAAVSNAFKAYEKTGAAYDDFELFSFRSFTDYAWDDVDNETICLSHPAQFNDPMDTILFRWNEINYDMPEGNADDHVFRVLLQKAIDHIKARCFIRNGNIPRLMNCDVEASNDKEPNVEDINLLMWSHYANFHKGFCIKYRITKDKLKNHRNNGQITVFGNINYRKSFNKSDFDELTVENALFAKSDIWEYEHEVRMVHFDPINGHDFKLLEFKDCIDSIYLGLRCSDENTMKMKKLLRNRKIKLYKMEVNPKDSYRLLAKRIL